MPAIYFTVTNDLSYDQRMIRICTSLTNAGYSVTLVGRELPNSIAPAAQPFQQKRLECWYAKGKLFYLEYNIRLFFYLLFRKMDVICAVDLDTIVPCYFISILKKAVRVYDAHELFCEMKEIVRRPAVYRAWKFIEKTFVPRFPRGYTVNNLIAAEFARMYGQHYEVIRSIAHYDGTDLPKENYILYQGAVNEGRCFETLIPAMKKVNSVLIICGEGNYFEQAKNLARDNAVNHKVIFKGLVPPDELRVYTNKARVGITLFENHGLSNYYSLANRFFDYLQAGVPQLCSDFPLYNNLNREFGVALLLSDNTADKITEQLNLLLSDQDQWRRLHLNCRAAAKVLNWENEEKKLISFYRELLG